MRNRIGIRKVPESELVRLLYKLSKNNWSVDDGFYPLGSCTMKYNPRFGERIASDFNMLALHPLFPERAQGALRIMWELERMLCEICGMDAFSLHPSAGAHGEFLALAIAKRYFQEKGETQRKVVLIPDSAHGTNPASAAMCGFEVIEVKSDERGNVDIDDLERKLSEKTVAFMMTYPNTLGLADENIEKIIEKVHGVGALVYLDGANLNALVGIVRPGDMGFDFVHTNLHKTFSTPHGGGGPGAGPLGVKAHLEKYLPVPRIVKDGERFYLDWNRPQSVGKIEAFFGNFPVILRAWAYIKLLGSDGLRRTAQIAVLNANYLAKKLSQKFHMPYKRKVKHEFVLSEKGLGVRTEDFAKALQDEGFHPPTIYFPLIVKGAMMIEPTETETLETLDRFADAMIKLFELSHSDPDYFRRAPKKQFVSRVDLVRAHKKLKVTDKD